jgi:hypothetical protein
LPAPFAGPELPEEVKLLLYALQQQASVVRAAINKKKSVHV